MKNLIPLILFAFLSTVSFAQSKSYQLSTHILDISKGLPASDVPIKLEKLNQQTNVWHFVAEKTTDKNGRIADFLSSENKNMGIYKLTFLVQDYFEINKVDTFYPFIEVVFQINDSSHYHVPITLSPYGYSTYRGN